MIRKHASSSSTALRRRTASSPRITYSALSRSCSSRMSVTRGMSSVTPRRQPGDARLDVVELARGSRRAGRSPSAEPPCHVVDRRLLAGGWRRSWSCRPSRPTCPGCPAPSMLKNAVRSDTRPACCMLWVTITIVYVCLQLVHQRLDGERGDRVERRTRLVHQQHVGLDGDRPGDAQPLLLSTGQARTGLVEAILHLVPQVGAAQRLLDQIRRPRPS